MSLYVNAALKRTRGGCAYLGHRGAGARTTSLLNTADHTRPRCQQRTCYHTVFPNPENRESGSDYTCLKSLRTESRSYTRWRHHCPAQFHICTGNRKHFHEDAAARDIEAEDTAPYSDFSTTTRLTVQGLETLQLVLDEDQHNSRLPPLRSYQDESAASIPRNTLLYSTDIGSGKNVDKQHRPSRRHRREECNAWYHHSHGVPHEFEQHLTLLRRLISEKKGIESVREAFRDIINAKDDLLRTHGHTPKVWLDGPWSSDKAIEVMQLVLGGIVDAPRQAITVLQCLEAVDNDFWFRSRCLSMVGRLHTALLHEDATLMAMFEAEVDKLRSPTKWPSSGMSSQDLSLLLWLMNDIEAEQLIQQFLKMYPTPTRQIHLWLAMYCARHRMDSLALTLLTSLPAEELQAPGTLVLQCCHVLLGHDVVETTADGSNFKLLPQLLEHGLTPDSMLYSQIIERALDSKYPGVAWDVFRHLQANKVSITGRTYFLLLRHAFNESNVNGVEEIMSEIQREDGFRTNLPLLHYSMNIVRRIFHVERAMTTAESLSHILALYDRVFSRQPLIKLGLLPPRGSNKLKAGSLKTETATALDEPDAYSLSFVVWAHVLCHRNGKHTQTLWKRVQELVSAGDVAVLECMRHDLIYNAFIWLNLRDSVTMADALEVLQYMLSKQLCMPTDRTWSILICGFLRHNQKAQAQHLFDLMKQCDFGLKDIRREYWRRNWTIEHFEKRLEKVLDESMMPDGTETGEILAANISKPSFAQEFPEIDPEGYDERKRVSERRRQAK